MNPVFLTYAGPPLIGAFIGYLTNKIAIKMLFRPLKPWRVLGLRLPMTPGVIPAKRHELAENIGIMVGEHLLTARDIGTALSMEPFQDHLHSLVEERVSLVLTSDLGSLVSLVPEKFRPYAKVGLRTLKYKLKDGLRSYFAGNSFKDLFAAAVSEHLAQYGRKELNSLISRNDRLRFYNFFDSLLERLLQSERLEEHLARYIENYMQEAALEGRPVGDLLPEPFIELLLQILKEQTPGLVERLAAMIGDPKIRGRIIQAVLDGIDHFLSNLGPMAAMAKGFIDRDDLDTKIRDYLVDHEEELEAWLQSDEVQREFARILVQQARKLLRTPVGDILARLDDQQLAGIYHALAEQLLAVLKTRGAVEALSLLLRESLEDMFGQGRLAMEEITGRLFPDAQGVEIKKTIIRELTVALQSTQSRRLIGRLVDRMVDTLAERPLGILARLMPVGIQKGIADYIVLNANKMLLHEVPGLVKSLNISRLVTDKVDSLDLLRLEGLLLSIMEEQFKYINLFGAILGFLIGLINLALLQL